MAGGWASLGLLDELVKAVEDDFNWILPTAIQDECIPLILGGGDVMASAETGSGKTAAFALPIVHLCYEIKTQRNRPQQEKKQNVVQDDRLSRFEMSTIDRDSTIAIDPASKGLRVQSRDAKRWSGCRATTGVHGPGKYYFECHVLDDGIVRIGWSGADASLELGSDAIGYGYGGTGKKVNASKYDDYPSKQDKIPFGKGDFIGCALELTGNDSGDIGFVSFHKSGKALGTAFRIQSKAKVADFFPAICIKNAECKLNFGSEPFKFPPPKDYSGLTTADTACKVTNPLQYLNASTDKKGPLAIVIEPTRDLAEQTYRCFADLGQHVPKPGIKAALLVGGIKPTKTVLELQKNEVDVLVGTPPIVASYMKKKTISPTRCQFFVLDEADELISTDSVDHINFVYSRLVASSTDYSAFHRLQVCFFSATLHSKEVRSLSEKLCHRPLWVDLRGQNDSIIPETVHHCVVKVDPRAFAQDKHSVSTDAVHRGGKLGSSVDWEKLDEHDSTSEKIKQLKPFMLIDLIEKFEMEQVLVFCRTNLDCDLLEKFLKSVGGGGITDKFTCRVLAGMRSMQERQRSLKDFKEGEARILICTDVAARGIDIRELPFVINMTLPDKKETYVHRIGRVGRAERMGLAISLVGVSKEKVWFCRKGQKPPCKDTRLFEKGGNCIWYDEPKLFGEVESLLKTNKISATPLGYPELNLPSEVQTMVDGKGYGDYAGGDTVDADMAKKMKKLESKVKAVGLTEFTLQSDFWKIRDKFLVRPPAS